MTQPFPTKLPTIDVASITATIENALASAGLTTHGGPLQGVTETIRRALSSAYAGTDQESRGASRPIDAVVREIGPQSEPLALPGAEPSVRSRVGRRRRPRVLHRCDRTLTPLPKWSASWPSPTPTPRDGETPRVSMVAALCTTGV